MGYRKKLGTVVGLLRDKASIIRTILSTRRNTSSIRRVILRATAHGAVAPPSDNRIAAVLSLSQGSGAAACSCVQALMDRLHGTRNASVALKCLYAIHNVIANGSFIHRDQLSVYYSASCRNFLNMTRFRDDSDHETWEVSSWVRWYAGVLEQNLMVSRFLGQHLCSDSSRKNDKKETVSSLLTSDLLRDMDVLVSFVEQIADAPHSLYLQKNSLAYEVLRLVGQDYRLAQREILVRVKEQEERMMSLNLDDLSQLQSSLERLEDCKGRLSSLFANRNRNADLWDLVNETKANLAKVITEKRQGKKMTVFGIEGRPFLRLMSGGEWLAVDRVTSLPIPTIG